MEDVASVVSREDGGTSTNNNDGDITGTPPTNAGARAGENGGSMNDADIDYARVKPESDDEPEQSECDDDDDDDDNGEEHNPFADALDPLYNYQSPEPDYTKANALPFTTLVKRFEVLWKQRKKVGNKQSKVELINYLLPRHLLDEHLKGFSPFPIIRLIIPDVDVMRPHTGMKEKTIANIWTAAMGLSKNSAAHLKLIRFQDPIYAGHTGTGDLSVCVKEVLEERYPSMGSNITVGKMNELLDELKDIKKGGMNRGGSAAHAWRTAGEGGGADGAAVPTSGKGTKKKKSVTERQQKWVEKLIRLNMSPLEHKWVVRIILQKLEIGFGYKAIIKHLNEKYADDLYNANNNLQILCQKLSDPEWIRRREEREMKNAESTKAALDSRHFPTVTEPAELGNTILPMLSKRTFHESALGDLHQRYLMYRDSALQSIPEGDPNRDMLDDNILALKFPTGITEVKLDGERMVVHVRRGIVTIQTRNSKWYSKVYSPVIAPAIRRAISGYDVDCILDGEIVAWDNAKNEVIPFGNNRTVANVRREYLKSKGMLDERDRNLHAGEDDVNILSVTMSDAFIRLSKDNANILAAENPGAECWLKYVVFDILHVSGPDASKLVRKATAHLTPESSPDYARVSSMSGSILNLSGYHRRSILYELINPQPNEVEHVESFVVTSDGRCIEGDDCKDYFIGKVDEKYGYPLSTLDSIDCLKNKVVPNLLDIDEQRRNNRKDEEIDQARANALDKIYTRVVDKECQEGLILKDLCAPYVYGRDAIYWWKLKADYQKLGYASDIDVIILGANYATGLGKAGLLSHFVIGCVDEEHQAKDATDLKVMTLGRCSGGGTQRDNLLKLLKITGFKAATGTEDVQYGKWFKSDNHYRGCPDFVSKRSFQRSNGGDYDGWKFEKDKYPDLWIRPEDSFVISVNAAEICTSDDYQAGVTLRFPRMNRIRKEGKWKQGNDMIDGDEKPVEQAITCKEVQDLFYNAAQARLAGQDQSQGATTGTSAEGAGPLECRFHTSAQFKARKKRGGGKRKTTLVQVGASRIPTPATKLSKILQGYSFTVLEGAYKLKGNSLDAQEAADKGWYEEAMKVNGREDVIRFIQKHGGHCVLTASAAVDFIIGGEKKDVRVAKYRQAIESAPLEVLNGTTKKDENLRQMMKKGVVKWSFVFSVVNEMLEEIRKIKEENEALADGNEDAYMKAAQSIKEHKPDLMHPRRFDYLVMSRVAEQVLLESEDQYGVHLFEASSEIEFKRALAEVEKDKKRKADTGDLSRKLSKVKSSQSTCAVPWQYKAFESFDESERWVFGGQAQKLWPYTDTSSNGDGAGLAIASSSHKAPIVLYPDLFGSDFGLKEEIDVLEEINSGKKSDRWNAILPSCESGAVASSLPLAKALGAQITPHLHGGITHVLVEMPRNVSIEWRPGLSYSVFKDKDNGKALHYRLEELDDEESFSTRPGKGEVLLVTPEWIRRKWSEDG